MYEVRVPNRIGAPVFRQDTDAVISVRSWVKIKAAFSQNPFVMFWEAFFVTVVTCIVLQLCMKLLNWTSPSEASSFDSQPATKPEFQGFQRQWLLVYLMVMGADWLMGPYLYALYSSYGYSSSEIAQFFLIGFLSRYDSVCECGWVLLMS